MDNNSKHTIFPFLTDEEVYQYWQEAKQMVKDGFIDNSQVYYYIEYQNDLRAMMI